MKTGRPRGTSESTLGTKSEPNEFATQLVVAGGETARPSRELVSKVRVAITEIMSKDEILKLLETRLLDELRGKIESRDNLRITPVMLRIAAESWANPASAPRDGPKHLHFHGWTGEQMLEFARTGKRPQLVESTTDATQVRKTG